MNKILLHLKSFLNKCIIALNEIKVKANKILMLRLCYRYCKYVLSNGILLVRYGMEGMSINEKYPCTR